MEEVEDEEHFLLRCDGWGQEREMLAGFMDDLIEEVCTATDDRKVALIPDQACSSREDMVVLIPAECLICMVVPVFPVSCLYLIPITDFHLLHSNSSCCISCHSSCCISCHSSTSLLYSAAWDSLS